MDEEGGKEAPPGTEVDPREENRECGHADAEEDHAAPLLSRPLQPEQRQVPEEPCRRHPEARALGPLFAEKLRQEEAPPAQFLPQRPSQNEDDQEEERQ